MTESVEAILFDMGGTLRTRVADEELHHQSVAQFMDLLGVKGSPAAFFQQLSERARAYKRWSEETLSEAPEEEIWTRWMLPEWPPDVIEPLAVHLNQLWRSARGVRIARPDTREVIIELNRRGYRLGLISNTTSRYDSPHMLEELGVSDCFKTVVLSATFGRRKPDSSIFLEATRNLGVHPDRSAYVGDRLDRDVAGARQAGFAMTIIIQEPEDTLLEPTDASLTPDHVIHHLTELLTIFPPLHPTPQQSRDRTVDML